MNYFISGIIPESLDLEKRITGPLHACPGGRISYARPPIAIIYLTIPYVSVKLSPCAVYSRGWKQGVKDGNGLR
jgi:hypothetical protein